MTDAFNKWSILVKLILDSDVDGTHLRFEGSYAFSLVKYFGRQCIDDPTVVSK